jgi:hypothetical protein
MKHARLLALLSLTSCTSPDWPTVAIDEHLKVRLPEAPTTVRLRGMRFDSPATQETANSPSVRAMFTSDRAGTYGIIINRAALSTDLQQPVVPDSFYNQGVRNVLQREHGRLLARSAFVTPAGKGIEVKFLLPNQSEVQYVRMVLVGRASYTCTFQPRKGQDAQTAEQRRRFLESISVKL